MKRIALLLLLCAVTAASGRADDDLVQASRDAKSKRKKSSSKVITNADVKKSKGVVIDSKVPATPPPASGPTAEEKALAERRAHEANAEAIAAVRKRIATLEAELFAVEQRYYEENDLRRRDTELVAEFEAIRKRVDEARATLASLETPNPQEP